MPEGIFGVSRYEVVGEYPEYTRIHVEEIIVFDELIVAASYYAPALTDTHGLFDVREVPFHRSGDGGIGKSVPLGLCEALGLFGHLHRYAVDPVFLHIIVVKAVFELEIADDQQKSRDADGQSGNIDS